jgi:hypothetical protein
VDILSKHILSVGILIPGYLIDTFGFRSNSTLLDADMIIFSPSLRDYYSSEQYQGKPTICDSDSPVLVQDASHWKNELKMALSAGKTVFLFLSDVTNVYVYSGTQRHEGTGRLARVVNVVSPFDPFCAIPIPDFANTIRRSQGHRIVSTTNIGPLAPYWKEYGPYTQYHIYLETTIGTACLVTPAGEKMLGGIIRFEGMKGAVVVLPPPDFEQIVEDKKKLIYGREKDKRAKAGKGRPSALKAKQNAEVIVGKEFLGHLIEVDKVIREGSQRTPSPKWIMHDEYSIAEETSCLEMIAEMEKQVECLKQKQLEAEDRAMVAASLKGLLFETGMPLELVIIEALKLMGFKAEPFKDGDSEFDIVFEDFEGVRFIGEAEGKNDKAINIDKLAQLERNIQEDFEKNKSENYAKPVLFGNAYRLLPLTERSEYFTTKCITGAKRAGAALVRTPDLFPIARYLKEHDDKDFAKLCRTAIRDSSGELVQFPRVPEKSSPEPKNTPTSV